MYQIFTNDIVNVNCKDGARRKCVVTGENPDGTYNVAYAKSSGKLDLQIIEEEGISHRRIKGRSGKVDSILPYEVGDLVEYHISDTDLYYAHVVEVGRCNTVKLLLGYVYMGEVVPDKTKGDYIEADVADIKYVGRPKEFTEDELVKYGFERSELKKLKGSDNSLIYILILIAVLAFFSEFFLFCLI